MIGDLFDSPWKILIVAVVITRCCRRRRLRLPTWLLSELRTQASLTSSESSPKD
jgi:hypothetical protein